MVTGDKGLSRFIYRWQQLSAESRSRRRLHASWLLGCRPSGKQLFKGCLQIDPTSRFQNATDVIAVLEGH